MIIQTLKILSANILKQKQSNLVFLVPDSKSFFFIIITPKKAKSENRTHPRALHYYEM